MTRSQTKVIAVDDLRQAVARLYDVADTERSWPMVVVTAIDVSREDLGLVDDDVIAVASVTGTETPETLASSKWRGGPVLAVGLDREGLECVAADGRVRLIFCVR